jgi:hypothetical protein
MAEVKNDLKPVAPSQLLIATTPRPPTVGLALSGPVPMQPPAPSAGTKKKIRTRRTVPRHGLHFIICGLV